MLEDNEKSASVTEEELDLVNRLGRIMISSLDINEIFGGFASMLSKRIPMEWISIVLIKGENVHIWALSSKVNSIWNAGDLLPLEGTATEYIAITKEPLVEPDLSTERKFWTGEYHLRTGIRSIAYLPLIAKGGEVFGTLIIGSVQPHAYREREMRLLFHVASQIAFPIRNVMLFEENRRRQELLAAISDLTRVINSDADIDKVYQAFAEKLKRLVDFDRFSIGLIEGDKVRFLAVSQELKTELPTGTILPLEDTCTGWIVRNEETLIEYDIAETQAVPIAAKKLKEGLRSSIHVPLFHKGEIFGSINLSSFRPRAYGGREREIIQHLASQISGAIMNAYLYKRLGEQSRTDSLTGLFNRGYFNERFEEEIKRHSRYGGVFSLAILDLDFFKQYNDAHGHLAGDRLLREIGGIIKGSLRETDLAFRYGGDEFALLMEVSGADDAFFASERIRKTLDKEMRIRGIPITASCGIALWPIDAISPEELITAADSATYRAKQLGGNQTCIFSAQATPLAPTPEEALKKEKVTVNSMYALGVALEARDRYTHSHSKGVTRNAIALSEAIGLPEERIRLIRVAAMLHDIGKIGIPDAVLNKKGRFDDKNWQHMKRHPEIATKIINQISSLLPCTPAILHHHERWDGKGYPSGLKGEEIPLEARILAIADAFDAMTSERPHRQAMSKEEAIETIRKESGRQFDPKLVETFVDLMQRPNA